MPIMELPISDLEQDSIELSRPHLDPDRVSYFVEHLNESIPVVVFNVNSSGLSRNEVLDAIARRGERRAAPLKNRFPLTVTGF